MVLVCGNREKGEREMLPTKTAIINGHKVEEYYWNGRCPVYVDNRLIPDKTFEEVVADLKKKMRGNRWKSQ